MKVLDREWKFGYYDMKYSEALRLESLQAEYSKCLNWEAVLPLEKKRKDAKLLRLKGHIESLCLRVEERLENKR